MLVEDGKGTGRKAQVDGSNRLVVRSVMIPLLEVINEVNGRAWSATLDAVAPSGATWFFVLQNNGQKTLAVNSIALSSSVAGIFRVSKVTGTPSGGTALVPSNMNLGRVQLPDTVLCEKGASITGLTEIYLLYPLYLAANAQFVYDTVSRIVVSPGTGLAIKAPASATVSGFIQFYEEPEDLD